MNHNLKNLYATAFWASVLGMFAFLFDFGFQKATLTQQIIDAFYFIVIALGVVSTFARYFENPLLLKRKVAIFDVISVAFSLYIFYMYLFVGEAFKTDLILENPLWVVLAVILSFIREFSEQKLNLTRTFFNPAQLFILSFLTIILLGALLLMLPKATYNGISYIDALFTSTSAVCVTGLIVVDTGTYFTHFGQSIILFLIQVGGLGILTFASYFNYFFKGGSTYENQLTLSEMTNSQKIGDVFSTLKNIIVITTIVELAAATLIFFSLDKSLFDRFSDRAFFSIFHAISAFCNAGFSTLSNSIYDTGFRFNYSLQLVLIATFVLGGLGFPIVVNIVNLIKHKIINLFSFNSKVKTYKPWVLNINSRITLVTTMSLTLVAFVLFFILEYHHTLAEHSLYGKLVNALFGATTPRTAGFNAVDMKALAFPTVMITFLLMWIGASPASTGGGIKTSTFAIATLNILSLAKGKQRIEVFRREIADISVKRAFATIALSLIVIGTGIMLITVFDPQQGLLNIAFESFSAYSTVGLSLGITGSLSTPSKLIVVAIMFIGRVSMLSIIVAVFKKIKHKNYRYPSEEITIN
ncbi:TrkH family potassium uptake protein [Mangrovimonas sp. DI 80]|uniref:TrkH family potassium uptake protein n=1 Tax=Mangrovimonas sp. DI 80 TaxID=1779330 RepID=UPI0009764422|nr:potassium transporter TrkG [Mangrovimonas sp. DI 80]OMP31229.1 ATPase [Mangrovimonas sp. DI 80]